MNPNTAMKTAHQKPVIALQDIDRLQALLETQKALLEFMDWSIKDTESALPAQVETGADAVLNATEPMIYRRVVIK